MKIYRFDPDTGIFQGEDFVDPSEFTTETGVTNVLPPEPVLGMIRCFDATATTWRLLPIPCSSCGGGNDDADQ